MENSGNVQLFCPSPVDPLIYKLGELVSRAGGTEVIRRHFGNGVIGSYLSLSYGNHYLTVQQGWGDRLTLAKITDSR